MVVAYLNPEHRWVCPNCTFEDVTRRADVHTRMHDCRGLLGMSVPMVPAGVKAKVELVEREDFTNGDQVQVAPDGRVYMNATVTRDEGTDVAVYAATATARFRAD